jgi:hypothetical protein
MDSLKPRTLELKSPLDVQSGGVNFYAANFEFNDKCQPNGFEFYYRTNLCGDTNRARTPHLQFHSAKERRTGNTFAYSFLFILLDYPVDPAEKMTLGCIFHFSE